MRLDTYECGCIDVVLDGANSFENIDEIRLKGLSDQP